MDGLRQAAALLTRVPIKFPADRPATGIGRSAIGWFPFVGGLVGLFVAGIYVVAGLVLPSLVAAALAVLIGAIVTGALHEDGLADCADAVFGFGGPERAREILKDSRVGTYGSLALIGSVLLRVAAIAAMPIPVALAFVPVAYATSKVFSLIVMRSAGPATQQGSGGMISAVLASNLWWAAGIAGLWAVVATGVWSVLILGLGAVVCTWCVRKARRALGGANGDVMGATEQLTQITALLVGAIVATHAGSTWPWL